MKKLVNLLLNKKLLLITALIIVALLILTIVTSYFNGFTFNWGDYFWFAFYIALILGAPYYIPALVTNLIDIHQNNLEDIKEQEL